jgi:lysophospholipase L1-like esterase
MNFYRLRSIERSTIVAAIALIVVALIIVVTVTIFSKPTTSITAAPKEKAVLSETAVLPAITALGDSISVALVADGTLEENPDNSWTTGINPEINSHKMRMEKEGNNASVVANNFAVSGSTSSDLTRQAAQIPETPQYVTLLSGANDICQSTDISSLPVAASYAANIRAALSAVSAKNVENRILVASIPSLQGVYEAGKDSPKAKTTWNYVKACSVMLSSPEDVSDEANQRRSTVEDKVVELNQTLSDVCDEFTNCYFDSNATYETEFNADDISSLDFFHPSLQGQKKLSAATWDAGVAAGMFSAEAKTSV